MKHMLVGCILLICMMLCIGCCTTLADGGYAYAIVQNPNAADRLNLRAAPSRDAQSLEFKRFQINHTVKPYRFSVLRFRIA